MWISRLQNAVWQVTGAMLLAVLLTVGSMTARVEAALSEAELDFGASLLCMASYQGELNVLTRDWLQRTGWTIDSRFNKVGVAEGRFHLAHRSLPDGSEIYMLAFPGTETLHDAQIDLRVRRVKFGGHTPAEFAATAQEDGSGSDALVHRGFDEFTRAALFSSSGGRTEPTSGEVMASELKKHPGARIYITGHSLGGAAATLTAARLADMGVSADQLEVITFGAPAVGNETFARAYESKFHLRRVTIAGDPVKAVLQSLSGGFVQFGQRVEWQQARSTARFPHSLSVYLDQALRHYMDDSAHTSSLMSAEQTETVSGGLYVAAPVLELDDAMAADEPYMKRLLHDTLASACGNVSWAPEWQQEQGQMAATSADHLPQVLSAARQQGCHYILRQHFTGKRMKNEADNYRLTLEEAVYDDRGQVVSLQLRSTTARELTPLEAAGYLNVTAGAQRIADLRQHQKA